MQKKALKLEGLCLLTPQVFKDSRGFFFQSYSQQIYAKDGIHPNFVQDNISFSVKNTLRGLHFQTSPGQAKLVSCIQGHIWDVALDIRPDSPTFGQWEAVELNDSLHQQLFIPVGFAHGFCVLSETALVQYKVSAMYDAATESSIRWNDPDIAIHWPIENPLLSLRDQQSPFFKDVYHASMGPR